MALLFTDTTYNTHIGLIDDEFGWVEVRGHSGQKASTILQSEAYSLCHQHGVKPANLKGLITVSGPGFYTGLRLSEGFADVFKFFNVPIYSLYSYEIPKLLGHKNGVWMTKAYRGEYFFHEWDDEKSQNILIPTKELENHLKQYEHVFIHSAAAIDKEPASFTSTMDLLRQNPQPVFATIVKESWQRESYYFRAPEDEFRVSI